MVLRWGCGIFLPLGFAVSLGQRKFSDLAFGFVLVRPSLILHCAGSAIVEPFVGFSSVAVPAAPVVLHSVTCRRFPFGCYTTILAAFACPAPALVAWVGQPPFPLCSQSFSCAGWLAGDRWVPHPVRLVLS